MQYSGLRNGSGRLGKLLKTNTAGPARYFDQDQGLACWLTGTWVIGRLLASPCSSPMQQTDRCHHARQQDLATCAFTISAIHSRLAGCLSAKAWRWLESCLGTLRYRPRPGTPILRLIRSNRRRQRFQIVSLGIVDEQNVKNAQHSRPLIGNDGDDGLSRRRVLGCGGCFRRACRLVAGWNLLHRASLNYDRGGCGR